MTGTDEFNERLARVRARFAAALDGKIAASFGAAEKLAAGAPDAADAADADAVVTTHRLRTQPRPSARGASGARPRLPQG